MLFEALERLFCVRNMVAHTGRCSLREGAWEREVPLGEVQAFVSAVAAAHAWLDGLSGPPEPPD